MTTKQQPKQRWYKNIILLENQQNLSSSQSFLKKTFNNLINISAAMFTSLTQKDLPWYFTEKAAIVSAAFV